VTSAPGVRFAAGGVLASTAFFASPGKKKR
jgi:hypothetical protein